MDHVTLQKKLSTYVSDAGRLRNVSQEVLYEFLTAWENWTGSSSEFYRSIGFTHKQMSCLLGKAKKLKRDGIFGASEFKQIKLDLPPDPGSPPVTGSCPAVEIVWHNGQVIRFSALDQLLDFLKKSAYQNQRAVQVSLPMIETILKPDVKY